MEFVGPIWSVMGSIKMLMDITAKKRELDSMVVDGLKSMNQDFEIILAVRLARKEMQLAPGIQSQLQDLAYEIDDFIQDLWDPGEWGSFILSAIAADSRPLHIQRINYFKDSLKTLKEELPTSFDGQHAGQSSSVGSPIPYAPDLEDLVGIEGPKKEILELLSPRVEPHVGRLSVISIVGCSGSGKTALAWVLYQDDNVTERFDFKSWVVASGTSPVDIVYNIRQQVFRTSAPGSTPEALHDFQKDKRYLIVVDDVVRETPLKEIKKALGENDMDSRIIVCTRVPSIVRDYSSGSFEYTMQGLDQENSRKLFRVKFIRPDPYTEEVKLRLGDKDVDKIIDKCDGLPIALISAAELLRRKGQRPGSEDYKHVSQELGRYLACSDSDFENFRKNRTEVAFAEMRRARVEPYENLLNHSEKLCLLYVSMFPCGHQIISKNLVRRLIAEGLVTGDYFYAGGNSDSVVGDARECVRKLMEHHMIEPVPARNYSNVAKRCRVHSIMLQFTIKKAVSRNLLGMIHEDDQPLRSPNNKLTVRRLTIQSGLRLRKECPTEEALSVLRSLAIFKMERIILDLGKCKRVRVLDLEGCRGLTRTDLDNICLLLFLKYLSLRNTAIPAELPGNMKNLKFLETLDTRGRGTQLVIKLPIQVLTLPQLAYLFGKFELTNLKQQQNVEELTNFFSKESALHTLGGIAVHEEKGLEIVLLVVQHATKLKKVKVWFMNTPQVGETSQPCLFRRAMQRFNPPRLFKRLKPSSAGPEENPINIGRNTHDDPAPATCTPPPGRLPCAGQLAADSSSNAQDPAPATCTPPGFPSAGAGPSVYSIGNAHDPTPATSSTAEPIPGATGPAAGLSTRKWYTLLKPKCKRILHRLFTGWKLSAGQSEARRRGIFKHKKKHFGILSRWNPSAAANPTSNAAQDPAPTTCTQVTGGAPGLPSAGAGAGPSEGSRGGNTPEPAPATSTPLRSDTRELIHCASRLTNTLLEHHGKLESVFIDFNGVPNTFPNFLRINGTISSIKLRRAQIILPGREMLGIVGNLKKLHLFSTGLESKQLASLQYLTCLQYLQLEEEGDGLWNSEFHVQARGFISLICLRFESSNSRPPPLKIDQGVTTPLTSLLLLCKETHPRVEGICHLAKLNEVILHPSATDYVVTAWKEQAKKHINIPHVEKKKKPV